MTWKAFFLPSAKYLIFVESSIAMTLNRGSPSQCNLHLL